MQINPILIKEMKIRARIVRIPIFVMVYNVVLAFVGIFMLIFSTDMFGIYGYINYQSMNDLFAGVGIMQCMVTILVTLIVAAGGIAGEREKGTLDMLFMTPVSTLELVNGKLFSAVLTGCLFTFSGLPILALGTIYGGTDLWDVVFLQVMNIVLSFFTAGIGLLCSSISKKTSVSVAFALTLEIAFVVAPVVILNCIDAFTNSSYRYGSASTAMIVLAIVLHVFNPISPMIQFYDRIVGTNLLMETFEYSYGIGRESIFYQFLNQYFVDACIVVQLCMAVLCIFIISKVLKRGRNLN